MAAASAAAAESTSCTGTSTSSGARQHPLGSVARENLKITDVKVTLLSYELPRDKQWVTGRYVAWKTDSVLVEIFTDKGIVGIGEPTPYGGPEVMKAYIESEAKPILIGKHPFDVEHLTPVWQKAPFGKQVAWAGIDGALWDIIGKAKGMPVYRLLAAGNPPNPHIRMYASGGVEYAWYKRPEDLIDEAVCHKQAGYTAFKYRIGTDWKASGITIDKYIPYVRRLREAVGPDMDLMQESNMRLTLEERLALAPVLAELKFLWFEEPIRRLEDGAIEGHLKIRDALKGTVKLSGGETMVTRFDFKEWVDRGAYDIVQPDINTTGITEGWHIARMAHVQGKLCCPHNWHGGLTTMMNAVFVAAIPNHLVLELNQTFNPFKEDLFKEPLVVRKGYMDLHEKPGYGVELAAASDESAKKYPYLPGPYNRPNPDLPPVKT